MSSSPVRVVYDCVVFLQGVGTLGIIPEPSAALLSAAGLLLVKRRRHNA